MADAKRAQGALEAFPQHSAEFEPCSCRHLDWFDLHAWLKYREKSIFFLGAQFGLGCHMRLYVLKFENKISALKNPKLKKLTKKQSLKKHTEKKSRIKK